MRHFYKATTPKNFDNLHYVKSVMFNNSALLWIAALCMTLALSSHASVYLHGDEGRRARQFDQAFAGRPVWMTQLLA